MSEALRTRSDWMRQILRGAKPREGVDPATEVEVLISSLERAYEAAVALQLRDNSSPFYRIAGLISRRAFPLAPDSKPQPKRKRA